MVFDPFNKTSSLRTHCVSAGHCSVSWDFEIQVRPFWNTVASGLALCLAQQPTEAAGIQDFPGPKIVNSGRCHQALVCSFSRSLKIEFLVQGFCSERREISSCLYLRKITDEIKLVIFTLCSVFSTVYNSVLRGCFSGYGSLTGGEASRGEGLESGPRFPTAL